MEFLKYPIDLVLHFDDHLLDFIEKYDNWTYLILFLIIFCETGLVVTPILPGDSLLFAAGAFAAVGKLNIGGLFALLGVAAVAGDAVNYAIGNFMGPKVLARDGRFLKKKYLDRTHQFYEKYGGKTIILARFVPIVRTFAPFLAGVGSMSYRQFATYNIIGAVLWISLCLFSGYFFGRIEWVQKNFEVVLLAIIFVSILPALFEVWRAWRQGEPHAEAPAIPPAGDVDG